MIKEVDGQFVISSGGVWLPGVYDTKKTATLAFHFDDETLQRLQDEANARSGGKGGVVTADDLRRAKRWVK